MQLRLNNNHFSQRPQSPRRSFYCSLKVRRKSRMFYRKRRADGGRSRISAQCHRLAEPGTSFASCYLSFTKTQAYALGRMPFKDCTNVVQIHEACVLARGTPSDYSGNEEMQEFMRKLQQSHDSSLNVYHYLLPQDQKNYKTASSAGSALVKKLAKVSSLARLDLLVVLIPADASISEQATWDPASLSIAKRAQEKPLGSVGSTAVPSHPFAPMASGNLSQVRTTMERCSKDEKTCNSRTNSCSGHGACTRKFANTNGECWVCQCSATKESYGRQYWGGPACQKRDISVQFWLFAGFAIFAAAAVTWAVGLLYNMGDVELPSVLSAGVAPTSRK